MKYLASLLCAAALLFGDDARANPVLGNPILNTPTTTAATSAVFKATGGYLYGISAAGGAAAGYYMLFDLTAAPTDGAVAPALCYNVPLNTPFAKDFTYPVPFVNGIVGVFSSTGCFTKTGANAFIAAQVK